jgi:hypothetical protein
MCWAEVLGAGASCRCLASPRKAEQIGLTLEHWHRQARGRGKWVSFVCCSLQCRLQPGTGRDWIALGCFRLLCEQ